MNAFTPSEAVAMAAMIEGQARAEAKVRQVEAGKNNGRGQIASGQMAGSYKQAEFTRESRQQIAEAVGMATTTLRRHYPQHPQLTPKMRTCGHCGAQMKSFLSQVTPTPKPAPSPEVF